MHPDDNNPDKILDRVEGETRDYIPRLNQEFFQPFDNLLERKAAYALRLEAEKGEIPPWLLSEIETLDKFREYMERLESFRDELIMAEFILLRRLVDDYRNKWEQVSKWYLEQNELFTTLYRLFEKKVGAHPRRRVYPRRRRAGQKPPTTNRHPRRSTKI